MRYSVEKMLVDERVRDLLTSARSAVDLALEKQRRADRDHRRPQRERVPEVGPFIWAHRKR